MVSTFARGNCMWRANHVRYLAEHERGGWLACMHACNGKGNQGILNSLQQTQWARRDVRLA